MLKGACLHILGPHEYIWNSMYFQINPQIVSAERGKRKGLCWFYCIYLRSLHPTHGEKFQRQRKQTWAYESVDFILSETLMYTTAVLQRKVIQTFLLPPPSVSLLQPFCLTPSVSLMFWTVRQRSRAFCSFREELGGGQEVTLGKVTDERAAEEGGGKVALGEGRVEGGRVDRQDRSQGLKKKKKPLKILSLREKATRSQVTTERHLRNQETERV